MTEALWMLLVVILANMPLQTVAHQFVLGDALKLHPLSIIVITTAGGMLAGLIGSVFAALFTKVAIDAWHGVRAAGVFDYSAGAAGDPGDGRPTGREPSDLAVTAAEGWRSAGSAVRLGATRSQPGSCRWTIVAASPGFDALFSWKGISGRFVWSRTSHTHREVYCHGTGRIPDRCVSWQ